MICRLFGLLLALVAGAVAQQPLPHDWHSTAPAFPEGLMPWQGLPPDTEAPPPQQISSWRVQQQIQDKLKLADLTVQASANDSAVILTGIVDTEHQHQLALGIAQSYAGDREILDRIQVRRHA